MGERTHLSLWQVRFPLSGLVAWFLHVACLPACLCPPADLDWDSCKLAAEGLQVTCDTRIRGGAEGSWRCGSEEGVHHCGLTGVVSTENSLSSDDEPRKTWKGKGFIICKYSGNNADCVCEKSRYFCSWILCVGVKPT